MRHTEDFLEAPAELTQRVWTVLEAISRNPAMRRDLFARATALVPDVTCGDGRILLFNTLETRVLEFDALRVAEVGQDGAQLLKFARSMIRLEAVEGIAQTTIERRPDIDPVEIRLALRIGLAQRLELPRQPTGMLFGELSEVSQADLDRAYATIVDSENTPDFEEKLVGLEYWCNYLKKNTPRTSRPWPASWNRRPMRWMSAIPTVARTTCATTPCWGPGARSSVPPWRSALLGRNEQR